LGINCIELGRFDQCIDDRSGLGAGTSSGQVGRLRTNLVAGAGYEAAAVRL
jgi:hypothetical protein